MFYKNQNIVKYKQYIEFFVNFLNIVLIDKIIHVHPHLHWLKLCWRVFLTTALLKNPQWFEVKDEVPVVWNPLAWSACQKNDCPPPPAARNACEALLRENWQGYQDFFGWQISHKVGKSKYMKIQLSQLRTCKTPWSKHWWPQEAPPPVVPLCE